jgi:hypothetical protein
MPRARDDAHVSPSARARVLTAPPVVRVPGFLLVVH